MKKLVRSFLLLSFVGLVFNSCKKDDPPLPPNQVNFSATTLGFESSSNELKVTVQLNRAEAAAVPVVIGVQAEGLTAGVDFNTTPGISAIDGNITATIPANSASTEITITKSASLLLSGTEKIKFTINSAGSVAPGANKEVVISLSAIVSAGATNFVLPGKTTGPTGSNYANGVYVDLSNNAAVPVDRKSWNIAFTTDGTFRVILNPAYQTTAAKLNKTDITTPITTADTTGIELNHDIFNPATVALADDWTGELTNTVVGDIPASEADSKVFIISFEGNKTRDKWLKVKVSRNGSGYKVQYANITSNTLTTKNITKNSDYNLVFLSLETGDVVSAEPRAKNWDFQWSYSTYNSGLGSPYWFQDFILLNYIGGAQAAQKLVFESNGTTPASEATTIAAFNAFTASDVASLTFSNKRDAIGDKWRVTTGSGIRRDRFYVIKDPNGKIYKLRFVKMGVGDTGERGRPEIDFKLLN